MQKTSKTMTEYRKLERLGGGPMTPEAVATLRSAINGGTGLLMSMAAEIVAANELSELAPDLINAYCRLENDPGCLTRTAIVKALDKLDKLDEPMPSGNTSLLLTALNYHQLELAHPGFEDAAAAIRAICARYLARMNHPQAHFILADLLLDCEDLADRLISRERPVRVAAVQALTYLAEPEDELLLRFKAMVGDAAVEVIGECFTGLMTMSPQRSLSFVARFLDADQPNSTVESAALAIGNSHLPEALPILLRFWDENPYESVHQRLLLPIALHRSEAAFAHLLNIAKTGKRSVAEAALPALFLYTGDRYVEQVRQAVESRGDAFLRARFRDVFERK